MEKKKYFSNVIFDVNSIQKGIEIFNNYANFEGKYNYKSLNVDLENEKWHHDSFEEFYSDCRKKFIYIYLKLQLNSYEIKIWVTKSTYINSTEISVKAPARHEIESIFNYFENIQKDFIVENQFTEEIIQPVIFIGHGRSNQWRDLKDHLTDKHGYKVIAYETGARAGHTIRDILEEMADISSFALLVMSGEDQGSDSIMKARPNVIHETGLFQGKLGFSRAIVLLEENTEEFSNLFGIQQIRFSKGNIKETYGDVLATIKREFNK